MLAHQEKTSRELRASDSVAGSAGQSALSKEEARNAAKASLNMLIPFSLAKDRFTIVASRSTVGGGGVENMGLGS